MFFRTIIGCNFTPIIKEVLALNYKKKKMRVGAKFSAGEKIGS